MERNRIYRYLYFDSLSFSTNSVSDLLLEFMDLLGLGAALFNNFFFVLPRKMQIEILWKFPKMIFFLQGPYIPLNLNATKNLVPTSQNP